MDPKVLEDAANRFVRFATAGLASMGDLADADAGRVLLRAVLRWWGIDAPREVERQFDAFEEEEEERRS